MSKGKPENQTKEKLLHPSSKFESPKAREHWMQQRSKGEWWKLFDSADGATCCSKFLHCPTTQLEHLLIWNLKPRAFFHCSSSFFPAPEPCSPEKHNNTSRQGSSRWTRWGVTGVDPPTVKSEVGRRFVGCLEIFSHSFLLSFFSFFFLLCQKAKTYLPLTVASRIYLFPTLFSLMRSFCSLPRLATWWPPLWRKTSIWRFWLKPTYPSCISKANPTDRKASPVECHYTVTWW